MLVSNSKDVQPGFVSMQSVVLEKVLFYIGNHSGLHTSLTLFLIVVSEFRLQA